MKNSQAFTLIELIIALSLLTIVILGIFSISTVLSTNNQDYAQRYFVKSSTQTTLNHILNNAALANGNAGSKGVLIGIADLGTGINNAHSFCIHQGPNSNIINSATDIWLCYTFSNNSINYCVENYASGASSCDVAQSKNTLIGTSQFLGTANSVSSTFTPTTGFSITIQNCLTNGISSCSLLSDPAHNPGVSLQGSVFPSQESW